MYLVFNGAVLESLFEGNQVNNNGTANGAYAGLGLLVFNEATANVSFKYNTFALNPASPAVNVRSFGAIPPEETDPEAASKICLELVGNVSDTGFLLRKDEETQFSASMSSNEGPMLIPLPLGETLDCTSPGSASALSNR